MPSEPDATGSPNATGPSVNELASMAESLDPEDRVRLIAQIWAPLPPKCKAAILVHGIWNIDRIVDQSSEPQKPATPSEHPSVGSTGPGLWALLFDPALTPGLYSAPRRFDLATIFVVTAAYSIVFGIMSSLNYYGAMTYFGPVTQASVGLLITAVAVVQALYQHDANPRGVSIVAGMIAQTIIVGFLASMHLFYEPFLFVIIVYGIIGGAFCGYLAGAVVGGVFLIADALRGKLEKYSADHSGDAGPSDSE